MAKKLYVGNLPWRVNDLILEVLFSKCGTVSEAIVVMEKETGKSRGFGFVSFLDEQEADAAMEHFDGFDMEGRRLYVNEARPSESWKKKSKAS